MHIHCIKEGENIYKIASLYGVSPFKLAEINGILGIDERFGLPVGDRLLVLSDTRSYSVKKGDKLDFIAKKFSVKMTDILAFNPSLHGLGNLYDGEVLTLKVGEKMLGRGIGNGYFYRGCSMDKLVATLPYMNYVTVSSCRAIGSDIEFLFADSDIVSVCKSAHKIPLLRIYCIDIPYHENIEKFCESIVMCVENHGFSGVTLAVNLKSGEEREFSKFVLALRKMLMEKDLLLFCEGAISDRCDYSEFADSCVLTYDKIQDEVVPSFAEGERKSFYGFAEKYNCGNAFIEISPFAYFASKYITKDVARQTVARKKIPLKFDSEALTLEAYLGRGRKKLIFESLDNVFEKYKLLSEIGFLGIAFDIMRAPISELVLFKYLFSSVCDFSCSVYP